ncbi:MAG: valine--pyruvate transaminase [Agarilytica sp.]
MKLSNFGQKITGDASIVDLMEDLGDALNVNPDLLFLGGGNPAQVPEFESLVAEHLTAIASDPERLHKLIGVYQSPQGSEVFIDRLVDYINDQLGWSITAKNIAITNGSQSAFFILINLLTGKTNQASQTQEESRTLVFPMMPEYLGYSDQSGEPGVLRSYPPRIENTGEKRFKYRVDFDALELLDSDAALCVSRPTNPTGNVLSLEELDKLSVMAQEQGIPLIIDCAYGDPFPGIVYDPAPLPYYDNNIYVLSCSKLGLPGARTGIVVGPEEIVDQIVKANTVISLANGNLGPALMTSLLESNVLPAMCKNTLLPFYRARRDYAISSIEKYFSGIDYKIHEPEGAFFLWLWFPSLPITSAQLYERMKEKGVLIMDGTHFFFGLPSAGKQEWDHAQQCVRLTYCQSEEVIDSAMQLIAKELRVLAKNT